MTKTEIITAIDATMAEILALASEKGIDTNHPQIEQYKKVADNLKSVTATIDDAEFSGSIGNYDNLAKMFVSENGLVRLNYYQTALYNRGYISK